MSNDFKHDPASTITSTEMHDVLSRLHSDDLAWLVDVTLSSMERTYALWHLDERAGTPGAHAVRMVPRES